MKIIDYKSVDVVNGFGTRSSIWFSGCDHMCKGCFSKNTWNYDNGSDIDIYKLVDNDMNDPIIKRDGISLLGGDPLFHKNRGGVLRFVAWFKDKYPEKTIWMWTGYTKDEISKDVSMCGIIRFIDVLIDGKFEEDKKDPDLKWRGSSNQIIHLLNKEK
ncbi:anaerobic NTP reductase small subunit [Aeromonas phage AS-yj]|uniref:Anaerobic NTP reductase small subunit n=7 Tax=Caudoviricetes TaxID=2731619 RepID=A0A291LDL0_9CAUD|nr:anaerobic ribonucleotide reductase small subunit [Aeromonas phage CC2]YP_009834321.1 anaerobic ribonucleotide reductase small subunit [Aeromonas phage AS-zj]YP_009834952.1 anaerobic ribonucleotide reductase small subunit [Aeromonas phage AS-sw]ATI17466.1 anaerobic NTP reductase small subunit [Aeromonas phage AS-szw]ATI18045.1 anaerobic NTP reductase small subunit [Aeromonas phage AS-yj]QAX97906.1 anaerobic NTP reductase small subunit [Aeromonas phage Asswx_1]QAX99043.1 anaerobic NTP reduct